MKLELTVQADTREELQKLVNDLSHMVLNFDRDTAGGGSCEEGGYEYRFTEKESE